MPLAIIGGLMMVGAVLGGATSSTISATQGINDACKKLDDANTKYNNVKNKWKGALIDLAKAKGDLESLNVELNNEYQNYKLALKIQIDLHRQRQLYINIFIGVFIFVIILTLLLKYFKVFQLVWDIIVKK